MLNPQLAPYNILVGEWEVTATHPDLPGKTFHGHITFQWIDGGAFLHMYSTVEEEGVPTGVFIFGSDDTQNSISALYFDERGVSRIYQSSMEDNVLKLWRIVPGFSQRCTATLADDHNTIHNVWELSRDDQTWSRDLEQTYTRVQ